MAKNAHLYRNSVRKDVTVTTVSEKTQTVPPKENPPTTKGKVAAWCFWDAGGAAMNAVATTFVFSVYLTAGGFGDKD